MSVVVRAAATAAAPELVLRPWRDGDAEALLRAYQVRVLRS